MAIYYARANGNVNGSIWSTTQAGTASNLFSSFTNADVLMTNGFTVTFNVSVTVAQIRGDAANSATNGGAATVLDGVVITADLFAGSSAWLTYSGTQSATLNGSLNCGTSYASYLTGGSGTLNINGTVNGNGGTGSSSNACLWPSSGTVNIVGNVVGGTVANNHSAIGVNSGNAIVNITGNISTTASNAVNITGSQQVNVYGTVTAGDTANTVVYGAPGSASIFVRRVRGNGFGAGSTGLTQVAAVVSVQTSPVRISEWEFGSRGATPVTGPVQFVDQTSNVVVCFIGGTAGTMKTLVDNAATVDYPANSNVRSGTVFANGNRTGTCNVPAASSVASGVPVDNTTGTAVLTSSAAQSACNSALTAFASGRLANVATVASTGQQIADAVTA